MFIFESILDVSPRIHEWVKVSEALDCDEITDEELWECAKTYDSCPHLGNLYQDLLLTGICEAVARKRIKARCYINAIDTHLFFGTTSITSFEDYERFMEAFTYELAS